MVNFSKHIFVLLVVLGLAACSVKFRFNQATNDVIVSLGGESAVGLDQTSLNYIKVFSQTGKSPFQLISEQVVGDFGTTFSYLLYFTEHEKFMFYEAAGNMNGTAIVVNYNDFKIDKVHYTSTDCTGSAYVEYRLASTGRLPAGRGLVFVDNRADSMIDLAGNDLLAFAINNSVEMPSTEITANSYNSSTRISECSQNSTETINAIPVSQSAITIDWEWLESLMPLQGRY